MSNHTMTPWKISEEHIIAGNMIIAHFPIPSRLSSNTNQVSAPKLKAQAANLLRATQCVNACEGIEDPVEALRIVRAMLFNIEGGTHDSGIVAAATRALDVLGRK